jgi:zinc transporter ZupT
MRIWISAILPILLLAGLLGLLVNSGLLDSLAGGEAVPPVERLVVQRVELTDQGLVAQVLNDGPDPVTIAQVQVDDAYWSFTIEPGPTLAHLGRARLSIPYPWVEGEAHNVRLVTSTGATIDHEIPVAVRTPRVGASFLWLFTLIGVYVGVLPVAIGLLWYPMVQHLRRGGLDFVLALTVGLLLFLLVDGLSEGVEIASVLPESFQGAVLLSFSVLAAYLLLESVGEWLRDRRGSARADGNPGWVLALLIAVGIGLHNLGEGLAIGAALALGEIALGSLLIIGFALHNTTEGLAIVSPLARGEAGRASRTGAPLATLLGLGLIGGIPTIAGAWIGGFVYSQVWALTFLGLGIGAIAQVVLQILRQMSGDRELAQYLATPAVLSGLFVGFGVMYATGMLIG